MTADAPKLKLHCRSYVVIPARLESTRLPQKLLLNETGKPLIQHTYEAASRASRPLGVCVAADDERIVQTVQAFGGQVEMTSPAAPSGTDRVAELASRLTDVDVIVNVQGDEPELPGSAIDRVIELLEEDPAAVISTLATPIRNVARLDDPACVKVVCDGAGRALYFTRSPIPYVRDRRQGWFESAQGRLLQHLGVYAYRRNFLLQLATMPPSPLEQLEMLEQLRVLEAGYTIRVGLVEELTVGIDTPADYRAFVSRMRSC